MPPEIQSAIQRKDAEALKAGLEKLPPEQAQAIVGQLHDAGIIDVSYGLDMSQVLRELEPLLQRIAAAVTDESLRSEIEAVLPKLEENGWRLTDAVHRIWSGDRDPDALTAGIDDNSAQLIRRILELLSE